MLYIKRDVATWLSAPNLDFCITTTTEKVRERVLHKMEFWECYRFEVTK